MNSSQATVLMLVAVNVVLMLLFPPYDSIVIGRGIPNFDAFYFVLDRQYNKIVNTDLLFLELGWVLLNGTLGWMLLRNYVVGNAMMKRRTAVILLAVVNLALILLFPPFENYASSSRFSGTHFDSFYFLFGDKWQRHIYIPLLYLEVMIVLINSGLLWLLFRDALRAPEPVEE